MPELIEVISQANPIARPGAKLLTSKGPFVIPADGVINGGAPTILRFIDCTKVLVEDLDLRNPLGPPDPDGQLIQFDRSTGTIQHNKLTAGPGAEDLISVYSDVQMKSGSAVLIQHNEFFGRGNSDSCTSTCLDGKFCPPTRVVFNVYRNARCAITIAGGVGHRVSYNGFEGCETEIYVQNEYDNPDFGGHVITANYLKMSVLLGTKPGKNNTIQGRVV